MKTKTVFNILLAVACSCSVSAQARELVLKRQSQNSIRGGEGRNGGGGLVVNGTNYITFGSAGFRVSPHQDKDIPGLALLVKTIRKIQMGPAVKMSILQSMRIGEKRKYKLLSYDELDSDSKAKFIDAYAKAFTPALDKNDLVVYAFTDENTTYLTPEFLELAEIGQAAVLYHESIWANAFVMHARHKLSYNEVIDAEIEFQKFMESGQRYDYEILKSMESVFFRFSSPEFQSLEYRKRHLSLMAALREDLRAGSLAPLLKQSTTGEKYILLRDLIGRVPVERIRADVYCPKERSYSMSGHEAAIPAGPCSTSSTKSLHASNHENSRDPWNAFVANIFQQASTYPESHFLERLSEINSYLTFYVAVPLAMESLSQSELKAVIADARIYVDDEDIAQVEAAEGIVGAGNIEIAAKIPGGRLRLGTIKITADTM